jgi:uncharacterized coiled-coil protein SlyX
MNPLTQSKNTTILPVLVALTLACFALSPQARAVCQEGCLTDENTVLGEDALFNNTFGFWNTAIGFNALYSNTTGIGNSALGFDALVSNTTGGFNTATGQQALFNNTAGNNNTAVGGLALKDNTTGSYNTATGLAALGANTTGNSNTATGYSALASSRTGNSNTAHGARALGLNETGANNTAVGVLALHANSTGNTNIALGQRAGSNLTTGHNNIDIGNVGVTGEANTIRIGTQGTQTKTFIAGISGVTVPGGVAVVIDANGQLGTSTSSARYKEAIGPMNKASEAILALKPVTFHYKQELDPEGIAQFGLVAEEVEKVNPDLVARDKQGKPYTVRYDAVNAMLLNEFLKEHRKVEEQEATIAQLKSALAEQQTTAAHQQKQIEALTIGLRKVSAQIEMSRRAPQMIVDNH